MKSCTFAAFLMLCLAVSLLGEGAPSGSDCEVSFNLGRQYARLEPSRAWFWTSCAVSAALAATQAIVLSAAEDEFPTPASDATAAARAIGFGATIALPLFIKYRPQTLPDDPGIDVDCFLKGYSRRRKSRNFVAALAGNAVGWAAVSVAEGLWLLADVVWGPFN